MLKRKITNYLKSWKNTEEKLPLLVTGARQVGKTYAIDCFGKENYKHYYYINFIENPEYKDIFSGSLSYYTIVENLTFLLSDFKIIKGETLLFLDEIQDCPNARAALKFINKDIDIIASGSLLGINYSDITSMPVGYTERYNLESLDFEEFLWAFGISENLINSLKCKMNNEESIEIAIHNKMLDLFKYHIILGGMPKVIDDYIKNKDYKNALKIQRGIVEDYKIDILKYASSSEKIKARKCFDSITTQLSKDHKKFQYSVVEKNSNANKYSSSLLWLYDAGIINFCYNLKLLESPLISYRKENDFKVYMRDTGLLISMLDNGTAYEIINGNLGMYKGAIYENIIADVLHKKGYPLYYFSPNTSLEIDFIIKKEGRIIPIEVKSADNTKSKSLTTILNTSKYHINKAIRLSAKNNASSEKIISIPLYLSFLI